MPDGSDRGRWVWGGHRMLIICTCMYIPVACNIEELRVALFELSLTEMCETLCVCGGGGGGGGGTK